MTRCGPGQLSIGQSSWLVDAWAAVELRLYELLGAWAGSPVNPASKVFFDACSQHHAWRADLWGQRQRALNSGRQPGPVPERPSGAFERLWPPFGQTAFEALLSLASTGPEDASARCLAAYLRAVLPRVMVAYHRWSDHCAPASDKPVARVLRTVAEDTLSDWQEGSSLLVYLLEGANDEIVATCNTAVASVEGKMVVRQGATGEGYER